MSENNIKKGGISVETAHIFPIIKKWLYSEKDIFLREIVSNATDAVTKLRRLSSLGEYDSGDEKYSVKVTLDKEAKTLTVSDNGIGMTEEELISIIEEAEEEGDIDEEEGSLIKSAIEFGDLEVGDIFTPRIDITALPTSADKDTVAKTFSESGYSRIPVYEEDLDNILGIVYYKDFFSKWQPFSLTQGKNWGILTAERL